MSRRGTHAVVVGVGMAELVHAATLAERFDRVTLVDRDVLPDRPQQRRGVPQGAHIHLLVPGGVMRLEEMLPGLLADMSAGAPTWWGAGVALPHGRRPIEPGGHQPADYGGDTAVDRERGA